MTTEYAPEVNASPKAPHDDQEAHAKELAAHGVQPGIAFPSASDQTNLLIIRLDLAATRINPEVVSAGLRRLCKLFADLDSGKKKMEVLDDRTGKPKQVNVREHFHFSATVGFGEGFFDLLKVPEGSRPAKLKAMPDHDGLGDVIPYSLGQTDLVLQLGSSSAFVNRWVLENTLQPAGPNPTPTDTPADVVTAVRGWATITDTHDGFQRTDGRNLQGFNDGVSNPRAGSAQFDQVVWAAGDPNEAFRWGTYMVFQKILHDLDQWRELEVDEQQEWVGRSKSTGLLLGTLDEDDDEDLGKRMRSDDPKVREAAINEWKPKFRLQSMPQVPFFSPEAINDSLPVEVKKAVTDAGYKSLDDFKKAVEKIRDTVPAWSHVRKVNPRGADGTDFRIIFRRGYPFMENTLDNKIRSGLLFVSFENDLEARFEFIKQAWAGNRSFPVPLLRDFSPAELVARHKFGRLSAGELFEIAADKGKRELVGLADEEDFKQAILDALSRDQLEALRGDAAKRKILGLEQDAAFDEAVGKASKEAPLGQQTGREGLAGPSEHGTVTSGEFLAIMPLGGGYYFVPPIPLAQGKPRIEEIGQQFFTVGPPVGPAGARPLAAPAAAAAAPAPAKGTPYKIVPMKGHPHKRGPLAAAAPAPAAPGALPLVYHNGALISAVEITTVFLGSAWQTTKKATAGRLNDFFKFIVTSKLLDQLAEFSVDALPIKHGKFVGTLTSPGALPHVMKNTRVQSTLRHLIAAQRVPKPNANTLYFVFLPPGIVSELQGELSCQTFCGFHDSFPLGGAAVPYAVIPFATCPGCTRGFSIFDSLTRVASHELCEAITNPSEGGWFTEPPDGSPGEEIGDLCSEGTKKLGDFQVQTEFSNKTLSCV
jgi:Dyp-type peroxidase family